CDVRRMAASIGTGRHSLGAPRARRPVRVELTPKSMLVAVAICASAWLAIQLLPVLLVVVVGLMIAGAVSGRLVARGEKGGTRDGRHPRLRGDAGRRSASRDVDRAAARRAVHR